MTIGGLFFSSSILKHNVQNVKVDCFMNNSKLSIPELLFVVQRWVTIQTTLVSSSPEYNRKWAKILGLFHYYYLFSNSEIVKKKEKD